MYKKLLLSAVVLVAIVFSFNVCFANNGLKDAADGVRNVVGDAENAVEGAAKDISNASKNATNDIEKGANNVGNDMKNTANSTMDNAKKDFAGTTNNDYMATKNINCCYYRKYFYGHECNSMDLAYIRNCSNSNNSSSLVLFSSIYFFTS